MYNPNMYNNQAYNQIYNQQQQFNPYQINQQQFYQQQPMQQQQQFAQRSNSPYCRMINTMEEIRADEIPMDGSIGIFVKNNMSELYAKSWNSITGGIDTIKYVPVIDENNKEVEIKNENIQENINKEFESFKNEMFERFDKLEKSLGKQQQTNNRKNVKEGE